MTKKKNQKIYYYTSSETGDAKIVVEDIDTNRSIKSFGKDVLSGSLSDIANSLSSAVKSFKEGDDGAKTASFELALEISANGKLVVVESGMKAHIKIKVEY